MNVETLSVFDLEYFRMSKILLLYSGLWPYESALVKVSKRVAIVIALCIFMLPNVNGVRVWCGKNFPLCAENIEGVLYFSGIFAKYASTIFCEKKIKNVYKLLAEKWLSTKDPEEKKILHEYAKIGKFIGKIYTGYTIVGGTIFTQCCIVNTLLDVVYPLNESRPKMLPVKGEFFVDPDEHHFHIYLGYCVVTVVSVPLFLGVDAMYVNVVTQSLATFKIVQHRLTKASNCYVEDNNLGYRTIISAIQAHKDALQFLDVIDSSYGLCLLFLISLTAVFLSFGIIIILDNLQNPFEFIKFSVFEIGIVVHLFYLTWPGQKVIDYSSELFYHIYSCEWYNMDEKGKVLMKIMMLRCSRESTLSAYNLYIMSFENYATVIKTTASYTAVAVSIRG